MSNKIKSYIKRISEELQKKEELDETNVTSNLDGGAGPPKTPFAFSGDSESDKKKEKENAENSTGYKMVKKGPKKIFVGKMGESIYKTACGIVFVTMMLPAWFYARCFVLPIIIY